MPYIITKLSAPPALDYAPSSAENAEEDERIRARLRGDSRAVATLEEARDVATSTIAESVRHEPEGTYAAHEQANRESLSLPEAGGTIGPLPDGTVIEVRPVEWLALALDEDTSYDHAWSATMGSAGNQQVVIDAYNAAQT